VLCMSCTDRKHDAETDVVTASSFAASEFVLILCGGNDDAISPSSELLWERPICDVVVDLDCGQNLGWYFGMRWVSKRGIEVSEKKGGGSYNRAYRSS
jgi:hypothetical protein